MPKANQHPKSSPLADDEPADEVVEETKEPENERPLAKVARQPFTYYCPRCSDAHKNKLVKLDCYTTDGPLSRYRCSNKECNYNVKLANPVKTQRTDQSILIEGENITRQRR